MTTGSDTHRWDFSALFEDETALAAALLDLEARAEAIEAKKNTLDAMTPEAFAAFLEELEAFTELAHRAYAYAALRFYEDATSEEAQALFARVRAKVNELSTKTLFFEIWWKNLDEERAGSLLKAAGERYAHWLQELRAWRPHTLSEEAERAVSLKNIAAKAHGKVFSTINERYRFTFEVEGKPVTVSASELSRYFQHPNPEARRNAYDAVLTRYQREAIVLGEIYRLIVQDWTAEYVKLRGFKTPISARNKMNDLPDEVVEALLDAVHENRNVFQRYFQLKAKALGMKRLSRYDLYAPVQKNVPEFGFDEAMRLVKEAFTDFDEEFATLALRVLEEHHLDVFPRAGKRSGAFSYSPAPRVTPFVLLNFQGEARDVATLAHELGHAVHAMLAEDHPVFTYHAPLPLAETASTFAEMLLVDRLLGETNDPKLRAQILFDQLDDHYATIQRQAYFARFEIEAHAALEAGAPLEKVHAAYLETLKAQFGGAVELPETFRYEWLRIPHFYHHPFYVYAYAFGQLLVLALYARYREEGPAFVPKIKRILAAGGSKPPVELLRQEGFDVADPAFWKTGYKVIEQQVETLASLLDAIEV